MARTSAGGTRISAAYQRLARRVPTRRHSREAKRTCRHRGRSQLECHESWRQTASSANPPCLVGDQERGQFASREPPEARGRPRRHHNSSRNQAQYVLAFHFSTRRILRCPFSPMKLSARSRAVSGTLVYTWHEGMGVRRRPNVPRPSRHVAMRALASVARGRAGAQSVVGELSQGMYLIGNSHGLRSVLLSSKVPGLHRTASAGYRGRLRTQDGRNC